MSPTNSASDGGSTRVKKTRRRLRLSCVECTKRRQKCDRNHPCGLCVSRGVAHLCRWETVPMARPAPSRPPETAIRYMDGIAQHDAIVKELQDRIAMLEQQLGSRLSSSNTGSVMSNSSSSSSSSSRIGPIPLPDVQDASTAGALRVRSTKAESELVEAHALPISDPAVHLLSSYPGADIASTVLRPLPGPLYESLCHQAQMCLAQHGEFIGRGSLMCALYSITNRSAPRFNYAKSTDSLVEGRSASTMGSHFPGAALIMSFGPTMSLEQLVHKLPAPADYDALVESYFCNLNWRYGISRQWFDRASSQMWEKIQTSSTGLSDINPHWLALVFSILAVAPRDDGPLLVLPSDDYFMYAMASRRVAEDDLMSTPRTSMMVSPADGTVLGCFATPILANFLSERGRASEAWKLVGNGLRSALAVGLHRDPGWKHWQVMSRDEKDLRRKAWWALFVVDRFLSYMLGRPYMIRRETFDVEMPLSTVDDGTFDVFGFNQRIMIELAMLVGEAIDDCFGTSWPSCAEFIAMDTRFKLWRNSLPQEYQESQAVTSLRGYQDSEIFAMARQRYILNSWYLIGRLKLHIASTTGHHPTPQSYEDLGRSRELCISVALELINYQCDFHDGLVQQFKDRRKLHYAYLTSGWLFHGCFSLLEACVALLATKERVAPLGNIPGLVEGYERTLQVLGETAANHDDPREGSIATAAVGVLQPLRKFACSTMSHVGVQTGISGSGGGCVDLVGDGGGLAMKGAFDDGIPELNNWFPGGITRREVTGQGYGYNLG